MHAEFEGRRWGRNRPDREWSKNAERGRSPEGNFLPADLENYREEYLE